MKILVIPELDWIASLQNRVHKIFQRLAANHEIHVIYFEHEKRGIKQSYKLKNNIILHKPPSVSLKNMLLFYLINSLPIYSYINRIIQTYKIQVVVTSNFLFAPLAIRAANRNKIPIIFDLVDFQSYHINYLSILPLFMKKMGSSLLSSLLDRDIKKANYVITTGLPLYRYVERLGKKSLAVIPNGVDLTLFNSSYDGTPIQKHYKIKPPIISFVGALEYWVDYDYIFHALSLLMNKYPDLHCLLIGPSRHYGLAKIKQIATMYRVNSCIIFTGSIAYNKLPAYICASDVSLLPFKRNYLTHCIIPMKLFESIACACPVIAVPLAGIKSVVKDAIFYAETPVELSNRIEKILSNKQNTLRKTQKALQIVKKYQWRDLAKKYEKIFEKFSKEM
ncbi:MAG: glycosyltransferase [Candidatus Helarchaeota archaeon]